MKHKKFSRCFLELLKTAAHFSHCKKKKKQQHRSHNFHLLRHLMATSVKHSVHGQIKIKGEQANFRGDETLCIAVRDTLRYDADCIVLGSVSMQLVKGQKLPIRYRCLYDPKKAHMDFNQIKSIPGGITLLATIERNEELLYANDTDIPLAEEIDIELVKVE